jgi:hypothetical protein
VKAVRGWRFARWAILLWAGVSCALPAQAHKASDAYLQVTAAPAGLTVRLDVALRDLDAALDLDLDADGKLTWGEVKAAWPQIEHYTLQRLAIEGCPLQSLKRSLERRNDGAYAALFLASDCRLSAQPRIAYTLLHEVDPTHRGIARIRIGDSAFVLRVLDPNHPDAVAPAARGPVSAAASAGTPRPAATPLGLGFLHEGILHILTGYDHVLFLLCLLLPAVMRRTPTGWTPVTRLPDAVLPIFGIVTSFTLAHSITLALAALKIVSLPSSFIEPAIAVTIVLAAVDNLWPIFHGHRAIVTFLFGLIHGFGFASVLAELNLPTGQFAWVLFQFNVGIEIGQLLIVAAAVGVLYVARRQTRYPQWVIGGGSCAAIMVAAAWFVERTANVALLPF